MTLWNRMVWNLLTTGRFLSHHRNFLLHLHSRREWHPHRGGHGIIEKSSKHFGSQQRGCAVGPPLVVHTRDLVAAIAENPYPNPGSIDSVLPFHLLHSTLPERHDAQNCGEPFHRGLPDPTEGHLCIRDKEKQFCWWNLIKVVFMTLLTKPLTKWRSLVYVLMNLCWITFYANLEHFYD